MARKKNIAESENEKVNPDYVLAVPNNETDKTSENDDANNDDANNANTGSDSPDSQIPTGKNETEPFPKWRF
jgi:hypothetical protein